MLALGFMRGQLLTSESEETFAAGVVLLRIGLFCGIPLVMIGVPILIASNADRGEMNRMSGRARELEPQ